MAQLAETIFFCSPDFHHVPGEKEYNDLQRAIDDIPAWGKYLIKLCGDFTDQRELRLRNDNIQARIDGQEQFAVDFATGEPICTIEGMKSLRFTNMKRVRADIILIRDDGNFGLYNCQNVVTTIDIVDGKYVNVYVQDTKIWGTDEKPAIIVGSKDGKVHVGNSFVKGGSRNPALYFVADSDGNVKIKNSAILHYDGADNSPIQKDAGVTVTIYAYKNVGNAKLSNADIANYLMTHNDDFFDPELNF